MDPLKEWPYRAWQAAVCFFMLAVATGMLFRAGLAYGITAGFELVNVRHAHSHTMYFGWATPALFLLIGFRTGLPQLRPLIWAAFAAAAVAYPLFLSFGYSYVAIGNARMPISVIAAGMNTLVWYFFIFRHFRFNRGASRTTSAVLIDTSLAFLLLATLGALGLAFLKPLGVQDPAWPIALTHIFLDLFSEGWFVLALIGLAYVGVDRVPFVSGPATLLVTIGLPFTFAMGMPESLVPPVLELLSRIGTGLVGVGLLAHVAVLLGEKRRLWWVPLGFLGMKAAMQVFAAFATGFWFADYHGLRILYLHLMLLGFVSCGLVAAASGAGLVKGRGRRFFFASVALLLLSLLPLTEVFPLGWKGSWIGVLGTWVPVTVLAAGGGLLLEMKKGRRLQPTSLQC